MFPEAEFLDHIVVLILIFRGSTLQVFRAAAPVYSPTNSAHVVPFAASWPGSVVSGFFYGGRSNRHEVTSQCGFDLHLPHDSDVEHLCMHLLAIGIFFLE